MKQPRLPKRIATGLILMTTLVGATALAGDDKHAKAPAPGGSSETASTWPSDQTQTADIAFEGGTVKEYIQAIRGVYGDFNVVVDPRAEAIPVPPVRLKHVPKGDAVRVLQCVTLPDGRVPLHVSAETAFYAVQVNGPLGGGAEQDVRVWAVNPLLKQAQLKPEDLLSAVEAVLKLADARAVVQFHRETGVLMVRGTIESLRVVDQVIDRLGGSLKSPASGAEQQGAVAQAQLTQCETEKELLKKELAGCRAGEAASRQPR